MPNFLDLRKKIQPQIVVVEKVVLKPRGFIGETLRLLAIITIASVSVWGISNADNLFGNDSEFNKNFSVLGTVSQITDNLIVVDDAKGSDETNSISYTLDITNLEKVETNTNNPLIISDIEVGDKIIAQGLTDGTSFLIKRIVSFSFDGKVIEVATTTDDVASTTNEVPPTTLGVSTGTDETIGTASTTSDTSTTTSDTASTTDEVATTTLDTASTTNDTSTTTEEVASTTDEVASSTPSVVETVVEVVKEIITNVVDTVVDAVTPDEEPEPEETPEQTPTSEPVPEPAPVTETSP